MNKFLTSNGVWFRFGRTVSQAVIGFIISNLDLFVSTFNFTGEVKAVIVGVVMCILAPVYKALGREDERVRDNA